MSKVDAIKMAGRLLDSGYVSESIEVMVQREEDLSTYIEMV